MGRTSRADRHTATKLAAAQWIVEHGGPRSSQNHAAKEAQALGVPLSQPQLGQILIGKKIGEKMTDLMAALYETTPDGLVRMFLGGPGGLRLGDVQGWRTAKAEAMEDPGVQVADWVWNAVDDVVVPQALKRAEKQMVIQIANFVHYWGQTSGVRKVRAATP